MTEASQVLPMGLQRERTALVALCALGIAMLAFVAAGPWIIRTWGFEAFIPSVAASGAATILAMRLAPDLPARSALVVIFGLALAMRLFVVFEEPFLSTDIYRYIWDGRVQGAGINPYLFVPADAQLIALRDSAIYPHINRADYAVTAYPPVAQMFFLAVTRVAESITVMRVALIGCEVVIVAMMIDLLRRLDLPVTAVVAWAWHPLAIWEIANNGHIDALMVALMMVGVWLMVRSRALTGAIFVALAALVKPYALVVLPAFWRRWDWRMPLAVGATIIICYLPFIGAGRGVFGYVASGYLSEEGFAKGDGFWLVALVQALVGAVPGLTAAYIAIAFAVLGWLALRASSRANTTPEAAIQDIAILLMAGLFFMSPNYSWYFLAVVPFIAFGGGAPAWTMTLAAFLLYRPYYLPYNDLLWKSFFNIAFLAAMAGTFALQWRASPRAQEATP